MVKAYKEKREKLYFLVLFAALRSQFGWFYINVPILGEIEIDKYTIDLI